MHVFFHSTTPPPIAHICMAYDLRPHYLHHMVQTKKLKKNLGLKLYGSTHDFKPTMKHKDLENETRSKAKAFPIRIGCCYVLIFCSFGRVSFPQVNIKLLSSSGNLPPNFSYQYSSRTALSNITHTNTYTLYMYALG